MFNWFGLLCMIAMMLPNILLAIRQKSAFENRYKNRMIQIMEQTGRFCCFGSMIFNIPGTCFGFWSPGAFVAYLIVDAVLIVLYCAIWGICWRKNNIFRAFALSILPSAVFLFSGMMSRSILLILGAVLFAPAHILLSYKNAQKANGGK